jgi:N-acetylmuramic acid 6-phosphate etherase
MDHLQTEARNPASTNLDELTPLELVRLMNAEDARVIPAVASQAEAIARAVEVIADRLRRGGRLVYLGAGTSGRLGVLDAAECPPTFSSPPGQVVGVIAGGPAALTRAVEGAEDHPEYAERDLDAIGLSAADVLVGIATSGRTPYVQGGLRHARGLGAYTIGLSCNPDSDLLPLVDLAITPVVGPEVLTGSTRLKAGTATKLVLNLLSTGAMVALGKTYGNLMVFPFLASTGRMGRKETRHD